MSRPIGSCAFCGKPGSLSKQHVLPDRLKKLVPRDKGSHTQMLMRMRHEPGTVFIEPQLRERQGHVGTRKLRRVCVRCNTGWMKEAEEAAFLVIEPMILGSWGRLTHDDQIKIAKIATIIASVADLDDPPMSGISKAERRTIQETEAPLPNWSIMLGRVRAENWSTRWRHHGAMLGKTTDIGRPRECNAQITSIGMGEVFLQAISLPADAMVLDGPGYAANLGLACIFPTGQTIEASDLPIHDDASANRISDAIFHHMMTLGPKG